MVLSRMKSLFRTIAFMAVLLAPMTGHAEDADPASVKRGAYLADAADCGACHTTPDHGTFAGGLPMNSPFGIIWSSNITPDPTNGIGQYTRDEFRKLMREGVARGGKHIYPAMPYPSFSKMTDADIDDLYAYFMHGVAPVAYKPPETKLPFPMNQRWILAVWDQVFAPHEHYKDKPEHDAAWNRGAYLVQSLGHCGACHTPRGPAFEELGYAEDSPLYLKGAVADAWESANLSGSLGSGLGRWSEADIVAFLKTGHGGGVIAFGSMKEAIEKSTQYMTDGDLHAVAVYLKSFPEKKDETAYAPGRASITNEAALRSQNLSELPGAGLYDSACARCHQQDGSGQMPWFAALAGNPVVMSEDPTSLIRIVLEGGPTPKTETGPAIEKMPALPP